MVTSISDLRAMGAVQEVELPGWNETDTVVFKLGRPSLMMMVRTGRIPNSLLGTAQKLFTGETVNSKASFNELVDVMLTVVKATLVEPKYDELVEAGIELTDEQLVTIFQYSQNGADALKNFRAKRANGVSGGDERNVRTASE